MTETIANWLLQRYAVLFRKYKDKEFTFKEAMKVIKEEDNVKDVVFVDEINKTDEVKEKDGILALQTKIDDQLLLEGNYRLLIRKVQQLRKESNLSVGDKIDLVYDSFYSDIISKFKDEISEVANVVEFIQGEKLTVLIRTTN